MTAAPGAGTAIAIIVGGNLEIADVVFTTPHVVEHTTSGSGDVTVVLDWEFNGNPANTYSLTIGCEEESGEGGPGPLATNLLDGRINNDQSKDVAAPVAIYLGSIEVYGIDPDTSEGNLSLYISDEQVEAVGVPSDAPVLLGEGTNTSTGIPISVYRLPTGEFLLMTHYATGTPYNFVWDDDGNRYHIPR